MVRVVLRRKVVDQARESPELPDDLCTFRRYGDLRFDLTGTSNDSFYSAAARL